jgi:PKD repeat protein
LVDDLFSKSRGKPEPRIEDVTVDVEVPSIKGEIVESEIKDLSEGEIKSGVGEEEIEEFIPVSENIFREVNTDDYRLKANDYKPAEKMDANLALKRNPLYAPQPKNDFPPTGKGEAPKTSSPKRKFFVFLALFLVVLVVAAYFLFFASPNKSGAIEINPNFSYSIGGGTTVAFTDLSNAPADAVDKWFWDFGDGNISYEQNPTHTYSDIGNFTVTLILTSDGKQYQITKTIHVINADDTDNDGYSNSVDLFPDKDAMIRFSITKLKIEDQVYEIPTENNTAKICFIIRELFNYSVDENGIVYYDEGEPFFIPEYDMMEVKIGEMINESNSVTFDVADDNATHIINIFGVAYDDRDNSTILLDLDGTDNSTGLTLFYDITTNQFYGDDDDGIVDGSGDGVADDVDCYLEYSIEVV